MPEAHCSGRIRTKCSRRSSHWHTGRQETHDRPLAQGGYPFEAHQFLSARSSSAPADVMTRVIFMCGPAGSGKTTAARRFEAAGMTRLSFDEEAWRRDQTVQPLPEAVRSDIESALRARLLEL